MQSPQGVMHYCQKDWLYRHLPILAHYLFGHRHSDYSRFVPVWGLLICAFDQAVQQTNPLGTSYSYFAEHRRRSAGSVDNRLLCSGQRFSVAVACRRRAGICFCPAAALPSGYFPSTSRAKRSAWARTPSRSGCKRKARRKHSSAARALPSSR